MGHCVNHMIVLTYIWTLYIILPHVQSLPTLSVSPSSVVVRGSITFTCTFTQAPLLSADILSTAGDFVCTLEASGDGTCTASTGSGCTGNTLSCSADKMTYSLTVNGVPGTWNGKGFLCRDTLYIDQDSQYATITILVPPAIATITPSESVLCIVEGQTVDLTCTTDATRPQSNITWYRDTAPVIDTTQTVTNTTGDKFVTSSVLTVSGDRNQQGAQIHCTAVNLQGGSPVSSHTKTVNIHYAPNGTLTLSPTNPTLTFGSIVTLTCTLQQDGNPPAGWTWSCPGRSIHHDEVTSSNGRSVLQFTSTKADNGRSCTCRAQSNIGPYDRTSNTAILNVQYPPTGTPTLRPANPTVIENNTVTLNCTLQQDGNPLAIWNWSCPARSISANEVTSSNGSSVLRFTSTKSDNGKNCICHAKSHIGSYEQTSNSVTLNIQYPPKGPPTLSPTDPTLTFGSNVTLTCTLQQDGNPPAGWTWSCPGRSIQHDEVTSSNGRSVLQFTSNKSDNGRSCTCRAQSNIGPYDKTSHSVTLNVQYSPTGTPTITATNPTLEAGSIVTLTCTLQQDGNPLAIWVWSCPGRSIQKNEVISSNGSSVLQFISTKADNGRSCTCRAHSTIGSYDQTSDSVTLNIHYPPTGQPRVVNPILTYNISNIVILTCQITSNGNPTATWIWVCGSTTFPPTDFTSSGVQSTLTFIANKSNNEDKCWCTAVSRIGSFNMTSDPVILNVKYPPSGKPRINNSLLTYNNGDEAQLTCTLTSDGNPLVVWKWKCGTRTIMQNEVNNSEIQSTARFTVTKDDDTAQCTCQATSPIGPYNSVSDHVVIHVQYPPIRGLQPSTESVIVLRHDEYINISAYFMGNPYPSIQWYFRSNTSTSYTSLKNVTDASIIVQKDGNTYMSIMKRRDPKASDFGEYVLLIQNHLGILIFQFLVSVEATPCSPSDVFIDCSTERIVILSWSTECHRQTKKGEITYSILAKERNEAVFTKYRSAKIHITKGGQALATLNNLSGGEWRFQIETRNAIGSTKSREVSCHITTQGSIILSHTLDGKSVAAGIGVSIGFMCCTGGIIYFVFKRRKRSTETSPKYSEGQLKESQSPYDVIPAEMQDSQAYSELNIDTSVEKHL